jgi:RimJ/RimL family protein N-acetyltransferase
VRLTDGVIVLRDWREEDLEPAAVATRDPEIVRWTHVPAVNTPELIRAHVVACPDGELRAIIADVQTDDLLGSASVLRADPAAGRTEIGYWVAAAYRGRGIASRAVDLLAGWAFAYGYTRLELHVDPANTPSRRVAEKAGFALEEILPGHAEIKGRLMDVAMYARLAG